MLDGPKIQLPVITKGLDDREVRLYVLVLAANCVQFPTQILDQAKEWNDWIIHNK